MTTEATPRTTLKLDIMKVYLLFRCDFVVCVCSSIKKAVLLAEKDACDGLFFREHDNHDDFMKSLMDKGYVNLHGKWYTINERDVL